MRAYGCAGPRTWFAEGGEGGRREVKWHTFCKGSTYCWRKIRIRIIMTRSRRRRSGGRSEGEQRKMTKSNTQQPQDDEGTEIGGCALLGEAHKVKRTHTRARSHILK